MEGTEKTIIALVIFLIGGILIAMGWKNVTLKQLLQSAFNNTPITTAASSTAPSTNDAGSGSGFRAG